MSRQARSEQQTQTKQNPPPPVVDPDFIPSVRAAQYEGKVAIREIEETLDAEDEELETEWYNPTDTDVILPIHVGTDPKNKLWRQAFMRASPAKRREMQTGNRIYIVRAKSSRKIPSEYDLGIQRTHCLVCASRKDQCKDLDHPRVVVAGLAPQLVCKKWHKVPSLSAALDASRAQAAAAKEQLADAAQKRIEAEAIAEEAKDKLREALAMAETAKQAAAAAEAELERVRAEKSQKHQTQ